MKLDPRTEGVAVAVSPAGNESAASGVAWSAILAGTAAALATTLMLFLLGSALGLASASPWPNDGASAAALGVGAAVWMVVMQWLASAMGGYITGRMRTRWVGIRTDEVFFRDTAHGFLAWAVATAIMFGLTFSAVSTTVSAGAQAAAGVAGGATQVAAAAAGNEGHGDNVTAYFTDTLYRAPATPAGGAAAAPAAANAEPTRDVRPETARILVRGMADGEFSAADKTQLARLVAAQTGMTEAEATRRVDEVIASMNAAKAKAQEAADTARKAAATASMAGFLALLIGAFIAAAAAAIGGRERDDLEIATLR
jgi:hypothetical protein